jgi:ceramide glucosyltransferase
MDILILMAGWLCGIAFIVHFTSAATVIARRPRTTLPAVLPNAAGVSILRPVCGVENFIEQTLKTTFRLDFPRYEIVFCVAGANDPVVPIVRALIAEHPDVDARLLIGNTEISANPKLNNLVKGWNAARYDWVVMVDSNVLMPKDHIQRMLSAWRPDTGLVCSPPIGGAPQGLWAELECAFLNTYQARWQCFADSLGIGFAQGKTMLLRRELLDRVGGIEALAGEIAEDAAATKIVRGCGLRVRLVTDPFMQPLGNRRAADVWRRQVRWARLRRDTFKPFFIPEIFAGGMFPIAAGTAVAAASGWAVTGAILPLVVAWYGAEALLAYGMGWHLSLRSVAIWMLRDALLPVLWVAAWLGNDFEWRGHAMTIADQGRPA